MSPDIKAIVDAITTMTVIIGGLLVIIVMYIPTDKQVKELIQLLRDILRKIK